MGIEKILTQAQSKMTDIESNVAMIRRHAEKINGIDPKDHSHLKVLKKLLDKLDRDVIECRAYMRIAEATKDE